MFGYINVNSDSLSQENKAIYLSYYKGLCQTLKEKYKWKGHILLNYDMTFLVLLLDGLYQQKVNENIALKKVNCSKFLEYVADMNLILNYHSFLDDWKDDKNLSRKILSNMFKKDYMRLVKKYPRQIKVIEKSLLQLSEYEKNSVQNVDLVSQVTGEMLGEIFAWQEDELYDELKTLGLYMGKFVYIMDAYEDYESDMKKHNYNPLKQVKKESDDIACFDSLCVALMQSMMSECAKSLERLPIKQHKEILRNIIYSGVWTKFTCDMHKKKNKKCERVLESIRVN